MGGNKKNSGKVIGKEKEEKRENNRPNSIAK